MTIWHTVFMAIALLIVGRGLRGGIERVVKLLMPALFVMLLVMIGYAAVAGDFKAGVDFLFSVDFNKITGEVVLAAIGQAFFSISVAMGLMMAYGAYVPKDVSLTRSAVIIAGADTLIALLAGLMIFPLVFANGLDPAEGPGLIFKTLPTAFAGKTVFDLIDYFTANVMMPVGAILIALFVGWRMKPEVIDSELSFSSPLLFNNWLWTIRVVAPLAIFGILVSGLS